MPSYEAIVIGLGGMGSAALAHLAERGVRVLGVEQFTPAHDRGSSHGRSRIIRQAYFEHPSYVPLLRRAYELWERLERDAGKKLMERCGTLFVGDPGGALVAGSLQSARQYAIPHQVLDEGEIRKRYPQLRPRSGEAGLFEPSGGALFPEECVRAHLARARHFGASTRFETSATYEVTERAVVVSTASGETFETERVVVCAGAWSSQLLPELAPSLSVERNVQFWFDAGGDCGSFSPAKLPVWAVLREDFPFMLYGIPDFGDGLKVAFHHSGERTAPERLERSIGAQETETIRKALHEWMPGAGGALRAAAACMYTNTPDEHFAIGPSVRSERVIVAAGFSGHGFKFCSVVGEILADLATGRRATPEADFLSLGRLVNV